MPYEDIYPPKNGGMLRCFNLFLQYIKYYDVTAVFFQDKNSFIGSIQAYPSVSNASVYSTRDTKTNFALFSILPKKIANALKYRWILRTLKTTTESSFLELYPTLRMLLKENIYEAIVLENLSLVSQTLFLKKMNPSAQIVYNSYNVDSELAKQAFENNSGSIENYQNTYFTERHLYDKIDVLLCCSENDKDFFTKMNEGRIKKTIIIPNGVDIVKASYHYQQTEDTLKNILFCGSLDYEPNKEGLLWFYEKIWPLILNQKPDLILNVVGRGNASPYETLIKDPTVKFVGEVESLRHYYNGCYLSISPLKSGSGTRLKILEAMSFGTPMVSTTLGAEGILCVVGKDILIADGEADFANTIINLIMDPALARSISKNARTLVEKTYSWDAIGLELKSILN